MPEATPFQTLGWFPFCLEKVNVSGFDYWSTLGGYNKEDADADIDVTPEQINLSLQNAMRLYWNLYSVTVTEEYEFEGSPATNTYTANAIDHLYSGGSRPVDRLCSPSFSSEKGFWFVDDTLSAGTPGFSEITAKFLGPTSDNAVDNGYGIVRMYDGATDNESNFIGYGIQSPDDVFKYFLPDHLGIGVWGGESDPTQIDLFVGIGSYLNSKEIDNAPSWTYEFKYTHINSIDVVCIAAVQGGNSELVDASNFFASTEVNSIPHSIQIDSITFYTYPA